MFIPTLLNNEDFVKLDEIIKNLIINNVGNICETFLKKYGHKYFIRYE